MKTTTNANSKKFTINKKDTRNIFVYAAVILATGIIGSISEIQQAIDVYVPTSVAVAVTNIILISLNEFISDYTNVTNTKSNSTRTNTEN
jgi:hypothetical protein